MAEQHLVARRKRRRRGRRPGRTGPRARRRTRLRRDFTPPARPDVRWCGDLTEIPTDEGKFYLAAVLDLHSRRCVGFAMDAHHDAALARAALCMAIAIRGGSVTGVVFHTDQGGEYTGEVFAAACRGAGVTQSMGRTGSALDNAVGGVVQLHPGVRTAAPAAASPPASRPAARWPPGSMSTTPIRRHSTNGMLSPVDYERVARRTGPARGASAPPTGGGMNRRRRLRRRCPHQTRRAGYGAAPPASRVAPRSLRDGLRPPLTPEPLRPLTGSSTGRPGACPPRRAALAPQDPTNQVSSGRTRGRAL